MFCTTRSNLHSRVLNQREATRFRADSVNISHHKSRTHMEGYKNMHVYVKAVEMKHRSSSGSRFWASLIQLYVQISAVCTELLAFLKTPSGVCASALELCFLHFSKSPSLNCCNPNDLLANCCKGPDPVKTPEWSIWTDPARVSTSRTSRCLRRRVSDLIWSTSSRPLDKLAARSHLLNNETMQSGVS